MENAAKIFAEMLRAHRKRLGLTQETLAECLGVTPHTIQSYEAGRREPDFSMLSRLAKELGVQPFELLRPEDTSVPEAIRNLRQLIDGINEAEARLLLPNVEVLLESFRRTIQEMDKNKKIRDR